tara:strand:+ start:45 stop:212 length:168 start_codon:yes stop_codon:yes gene_type:complete
MQNGRLYKFFGSFGDFGDFGNTTGGLVKRDHASMAWMNQGFDSLILHQVVPSSIG